MNTNGKTTLKEEAVASHHPEILALYCARILIVDDDSHARAMNALALMKSGYKIQTAANGAAAWRALNGRNYDLLITDNRMPRMTGMEMIAKLRSARMTVPVIMATGMLPMNEIAHNPWLKPDAMLQRPFSDEDLLVAVKRILSPEAIVHEKHCTAVRLNNELRAADLRP